LGCTSRRSAASRASRVVDRAQHQCHAPDDLRTRRVVSALPVSSDGCVVPTAALAHATIGAAATAITQHASSDILDEADVSSDRRADAGTGIDQSKEDRRVDVRHCRAGCD